VNFQKHAATTTATNSRVAPTPPWIRAAMTRPPRGGSVGFYDDPDEDTIEMVLSPEDMRKLSRAAEEQPVAPTPTAGAAMPAEAATPASQDRAPKPGLPQRTLPEAQTAPSSSPSSSAKPLRSLDAPLNSPKEAPSTPPSPPGQPADPARASIAPGRSPPPTPSAAPSAPGTKAQAEHLLQTRSEAAQSKLPRASSPSGVLPSTSPATRDAPGAASSAPHSPQVKLAAAPSAAPATRNTAVAASAASHPQQARKNAAATGVPTPEGAKSASLKKRSPALLAGCTLAAVAAALLIVGTAGLWSTSPTHGIEQQQTELATPNSPRPQPPLAAPQAPSAVAPAATPQQPAEPQPTTPVRFKNPFDRSEIFEFPAGTSLEDARQSVASLLLQRARDRRHPGMAQRRNINGVTPDRPSNADLVQNAVRGR
jgi:hypothetical protein